MSAVSADSSRRSQWLPLLALAVLSACWGYTWVVAKMGLAHAGPFTFAFQRSLGGAAALFLALIVTRRSLRIQVPWSTFWLGVVQTGGFMLFQTWALVEGGAGKTAVLIYTMPIWTLLLAWPILGERLRGAQWAAALCTVTGLILVISPWDLHTSLFSKFLGVTAATVWAVGTVMMKRLRARVQVDLLNLTAWQVLIGTGFLLTVHLLTNERATDWSNAYIAELAFISVISSALGWFLWFYVLDWLPAWEASLSVLGIPVVAMASSRMQLGEGFTALEMGGIALIGGGLGLLSLVGWLTARRAARITETN